MHASARFSSSFASSRKGWSSFRPLCGKKHLGSLSAQDPPKVQKRLTKEGRRARVEEFVENFRASHEGKFPHATFVRQQVGGSYYTVLALLQELEYNSRLKNDLRNASFSSENFKEKYGLHNIDLSPRVATTNFQGVKEEMAKTSEPLDLNTKPQLLECHGKAGAAEPKLSPTCLEDKSEPMASGQTENNNVVKAQNLKSPKHALEASKGAILWGSLKSFAGGLRIFWNNL